jgi:hypothetical protein
MTPDDLLVDAGRLVAVLVGLGALCLAIRLIEPAIRRVFKCERGEKLIAKASQS